jgi:hypothetical protein
VESTKVTQQLSSVVTLGQPNDLVVPTLGGSEVNGQDWPATQVGAYPQSADVYHLDYFYQQGTWDSILGFL